MFDQLTVASALCPAGAATPGRQCGWKEVNQLPRQVNLGATELCHKLSPKCAGLRDTVHSLVRAFFLAGKRDYFSQICCCPPSLPPAQSTARSVLFRHQEHSTRGTTRRSDRVFIPPDPQSTVSALGLRGNASFILNASPVRGFTVTSWHPFASALTHRLCVT